MIDALLFIERGAIWLMWIGLVLTVVMTCALVANRVCWKYHVTWRHRFERRYQPLIRRALTGDQAARHLLVTAPRRRHVSIAELLIAPLVDDRDAGRIAATRAIVHAMFLVPVADRYLRSRWWWRRALALRALGLLQMTDHTAAIIAALDDDHADVRGAALDALTDLHDPAALPALVVRMNDASLHRGRRAAALAAYGSRCEPLVLELSGIDPEHLVNYAQVLAHCGTELSRSVLCRWTEDTRVEVRAAAFAALGHVGLDDRSVSAVLRGLESREVPVRAMAARALRAYTGAGDTAAHLARHLDDAWPVAVQAARSLLSMPAAGLSALQEWATRSDLAGLLARQMLWEASHRS